MRLGRGREYLALGKTRVAFFAAASAGAGYLARSGRPAPDLAALWAGVFLLACGAGALTHYQDRHIDGAMERTKQRPLPSAAVKPAAALAMAAVLSTLGLMLLGLGGPVPVVLGGAALAWYNGVYAGLKRITPFAAVPGAVTGALPPAIGWMWAGGGPGGTGLWALCLLAIIWQVPHFWLIALEHGPDFRRSGLPTLTDVLSEDQVRRVISAWTMAVAAGALLLASGAVVKAPLTRLVILVLSFRLGILALRFHGRAPRPGLGLLRNVNLTMVAVMAAICLDGVLAGLTT
jgi:protoheme IX farnesyltransferase